jgi:hypothetical protein
MNQNLMYACIVGSLFQHELMRKRLANGNDDRRVFNDDYRHVELSHMAIQFAPVHEVNDHFYE